MGLFIVPGGGALACQIANFENILDNDWGVGEGAELCKKIWGKLIEIYVCFLHVGCWKLGNGCLFIL